MMLCHMCTIHGTPQDEKNLWCGREVLLNNTQPMARNGDYYKFEIPLTEFKCDAGSSIGSLANVNRVDFMNVRERDADYCLDDIVLVAKSGLVTSERATAATPGRAVAGSG
jgi:hypothetical protein